MRKVFIVLMALLVCANVFAAATSKTVTVKSHVGTLTISEANANSTSGLYVLKVGATTESASEEEYVSSADISKEDVVAGFKVIQDSQTKTGETIGLSVTFGKLAYNGNYSNAPVISEYLQGGGFFTTPNQTITGSELSFSIKYQGASNPVDKNTTICSFKATWPKTETLTVEGDYSADVTLSYTIQ